MKIRRRAEPGFVRRIVALVGVGSIVACGAAAGPAIVTPPPVVTRAHGSEAALASVTLTAEAAQRLGVTLAPIELRRMSDVLRLPGDVLAPPGRSVTIAAPVAGLIVAPEGLPRVGSAVTRGQALARLVPLAVVDRDLRAQARSRVTTAEARLLAGNSRAQRAETLISSGAGSQRAAEDARVERDIAAAELTAAQARLRMIDRTPLASDVTTVLRAPFAAVVRQVQVADGQAVGGGAALIELVASDAPWVRVAVPVARLGEVSAGPVKVGALASDALLIATPVPGPPTADPLAGTVDLYFELAALATLRLGERVQVELPVAGEAEVLAVPASAVIHDIQGGTWLYEQVAEFHYERRRVELAAVVDGVARLTRGPAPGASVVIAGAVELFGAEFGAGH